MIPQFFCWRHFSLILIHMLDTPPYVSVSFYFLLLFINFVVSTTKAGVDEDFQKEVSIL